MSIAKLSATTLVVLGITLGLSGTPALAAEPPTIISESAPAPKAEEARLEAIVNPNNQSSECHFQYGETTVGENEVACEQPTIEGGEQGVGLSIGALKQNTAYHYRVILKNTANEEAIGSTETFTTALRPQAPVTLAAELVTGTTATLEGELNPGVSAKDGFYFTYDTNGTCEPAFVTPPGEETTEAKRIVSAPVSELVGSTQYTFCVVASNEVGEATSGPPLSFTTPASKPVIVSEAESAITPFDATLEGAVNPENQETTYHLEYATDTAFTENVKKLAFAIQGPGVSSPQPVGPVDLGGALTPSTTYYYRVIAKNATGEEQGATKEFQTLALEKAVIEAGSEKATPLNHTEVLFEAQVNPNYQETTWTILYGESEAELLNAPKTAGSSVLGGFGAQPAAAQVGGLGAKAYFYQVTASNTAGEEKGPIQELRHQAPELGGPASAEQITQHTASIALPSINPEVEAPLEGTYYVLYGIGAPDELVTAHSSAGSGLTPITLSSVALSSLQPGTTYHYQVITYNVIGTETTAEQTFTTAPADPLTTPPSIGGSSAQFVNEASAVIEGEVNPQGLQTSYEVQYGPTSAYGSSTPGPTSIGPFTSAQGTITALTGLAPGTTYHYRLAASNAAGTSYGPDQSFTSTGVPRSGSFTSFPVSTVPLLAAIPAAFPADEPASPPKPALTRKQQLAKALAACKRKRNRAKRSACQRQAQRRYGARKASSGRGKVG